MASRNPVASGQMATPSTPQDVLEAARAAVLAAAPEANRNAVKTADALEVLHAYLGIPTTKADFRQALQFIAPAARLLEEDDRDELRDKASVMLASFNNRLPTKALNGRPVRIQKARFLDTKFGSTFLLTGYFLDEPGDPNPATGPSREWECWMPGTENGPVYRFFARRRRDQYPVDLVFTQEDIIRKDGEKGTMWRVERLADEPEAFREVPF